MKKKITITVKPNSKKPGVEKISDDQYIIRVSQPPIDGKANQAVIEILADYFDLSKSKIKMVKGEKSKTKVVELIIS